jgi:hypothetical protein
MTRTASFTRGVLKQKEEAAVATQTAAVTAAFLTTGLMCSAASPASATGTDGIAWMYDVDGTGGVDPSASDTTGPWGVPDGARVTGSRSATGGYAAQGLDVVGLRRAGC